MPILRRMGRSGGPRWRGLESVDGVLWYRRPIALERRPRLRFEPGGLVVVTFAGETTWPWSECGTRGEGWFVQTHGPSGYKGTASGLVLHGGAEDTVLGLGTADALWDVVPALVQYLAETPDARAGLGDPGRIAALIDALRSRSRFRLTLRSQPRAPWPFDVLRAGDAKMGHG